MDADALQRTSVALYDYLRFDTTLNAVSEGHDGTGSIYSTLSK